MLREFIKTVCRIAKATDAEQNLCRKHLAVFFGSAGRHFLPQAVSANFNNTFDLFSAWNGRTAPAFETWFCWFWQNHSRKVQWRNIFTVFVKMHSHLPNTVGFRRFGASAEVEISGFLKSTRCLTEHKIITETEANEVRRRSIYKGFHRNC